MDLGDLPTNHDDPDAVIDTVLRFIKTAGLPFQANRKQVDQVLTALSEHAHKLGLALPQIEFFLRDWIFKLRTSKSVRYIGWLRSVGEKNLNWLAQKPNIQLRWRPAPSAPVDAPARTVQTPQPGEKPAPPATSRSDEYIPERDDPFWNPNEKSEPLNDDEDFFGRPKPAVELAAAPVVVDDEDVLAMAMASAAAMPDAEPRPARHAIEPLPEVVPDAPDPAGEWETEMQRAVEEQAEQERNRASAVRRVGKLLENPSDADQIVDEFSTWCSPQQLDSATYYVWETRHRKAPHARSTIVDDLRSEAEAYAERQVATARRLAVLEAEKEARIAAAAEDRAKAAKLLSV